MAARFRTLMCILLSVVLVSFPPTISHAASGIHSEHHPVAAQSEHENTQQAHCLFPSVSSSDEQRAHPDNSEDHPSGKCCNGIYLTDALDETTSVLSEYGASAAFVLQHDQAGSIESAGLIRPPRNLI
ncbi:hypothetical protein [Roseovarius azorensis]|uniref:hypothetical protein n=1 Tax=Roseovarius azorensis TaxID=1287727 RepID=UPI001114D707|nr:hypothetical protein [Roseovarius azorensis]